MLRMERTCSICRFLNEAEPLTHVAVMFIQDYNDASTEIHLIHTGWRNDENWEKARIWFDSVWKSALNSLKGKINFKFIEICKEKSKKYDRDVQ